MKRTIVFIIISILLFCLVGNNAKGYNKSEEEIVENISSKIIRFHVIANSDSKEDQELKLKVRDEILKYISPKLKNSKDIKESRKILKKHNKEIIDIAKSVVEKNGYNYKVQSTLSRENFPQKTYGNITLPQGNYEAYRIIIGTGYGHNWWCVMFPPLCFIDESKSKVDEEATEKEMKMVLDNEEYDCINNSNKHKIKVKFKIFKLLGKK